MVPRSQVEQDSQAVVAPLNFFHDIKTAVHDELIHVPCLFSESCNTITASFGRAEFDLE